MGQQEWQNALWHRNDPEVHREGRRLRAVRCHGDDPQKATFAEVKAHVERADVCVVPAAGVIGEAMLAIVLAEALLEKFGGDSMKEILRNYNGYQAQVNLLFGI